MIIFGYLEWAKIKRMTKSKWRKAAYTLTIPSRENRKTEEETVDDCEGRKEENFQDCEFGEIVIKTAKAISKWKILLVSKQSDKQTRNKQSEKHLTNTIFNSHDIDGIIYVIFRM